MEGTTSLIATFHLQQKQQQQYHQKHSDMIFFENKSNNKIIHQVYFKSRYYVDMLVRISVLIWLIICKDRDCIMGFPHKYKECRQQPRRGFSGINSLKRELLEYINN